MLYRYSLLHYRILFLLHRLDILKSYKYKTKNILNQIDIDFPRINVSLNNKKIQLISAYPLDYNGKKYKMIFVFEDFN